MKALDAERSAQDEASLKRELTLPSTTMFNSMLKSFPASLRAGLRTLPSFAWTNPSVAFAPEYQTSLALLVAVVVLVASTLCLLGCRRLRAPASDDGDLSLATDQAEPQAEPVNFRRRRVSWSQYVEFVYRTAESSVSLAGFENHELNETIERNYDETDEIREIFERWYRAYGLPDHLAARLLLNTLAYIYIVS